MLNQNPKQAEPELSDEAIQRIADSLPKDVKLEDVRARVGWLVHLRSRVPKFDTGGPNAFLDSLKAMEDLRLQLDRTTGKLTDLEPDTRHILNIILQEHGGLSTADLEGALTKAAGAIRSYHETRGDNIPEPIRDIPDTYRLNALIKILARYFRDLTGLKPTTSFSGHFVRFVKTVSEEIGEEKTAGLRDRIVRVSQAEGL